MTVFRFIRDCLAIIACLCVIAAFGALVTGALIPHESRIRIEQPIETVPVPTPICPSGIEGC